MIIFDIQGGELVRRTIGAGGQGSGRHSGDGHTKGVVSVPQAYFHPSTGFENSRANNASRTAKTPEQHAEAARLHKDAARGANPASRPASDAITTYREAHKAAAAYHIAKSKE